MPAARAEEKGESSTAVSKAALAASSNGTQNYELPWLVLVLKP
jgi:replication factor C subunit 2/4